jgi:hypothetical protein
MEKQDLEQQKAQLLEAKEDCLRRMDARTRRRYQEKVGMGKGGCSTNSQTMGRSNTAGHLLDEAAEKVREVIDHAMICGAFRDASRAIHNLIEIAKLKRQFGGELDEQTNWRHRSIDDLKETLPPDVFEVAQATAKLDPADRMLLRAGFDKLERMHELAFRELKDQHDGRSDAELRRDAHKNAWSLLDQVRCEDEGARRDGRAERIR